MKYLGEIDGYNVGIRKIAGGELKKETKQVKALHSKIKKNLTKIEKLVAGDLKLLDKQKTDDDMIKMHRNGDSVVQDLDQLNTALENVIKTRGY